MLYSTLAVIYLQGNLPDTCVPTIVVRLYLSASFCGGHDQTIATLPDNVGYPGIVITQWKATGCRILRLIRITQEYRLVSRDFRKGRAQATPSLRSGTNLRYIITT